VFGLFVKKKKSPQIFQPEILLSKTEIMADDDIYNFQCDLGTSASLQR
jgi:hypothetical protein